MRKCVTLVMLATMTVFLASCGQSVSDDTAEPDTVAKVKVTPEQKQALETLGHCLFPVGPH